MKKMMFLATIVAAMMICAPANAQTRKDKKAAQKAQWEQQQRQQQEEAALLHQLRMDSIRNAQKAQSAAAQQAEIDAQQAREKKAAEEAAAAKNAARAHKAIKVPCKGVQYKSDEIKLRAFASREGLDMDAAQQAAFSSARQNMAALIESNVQSLSADYLKSLGKTKSIDQERKLEQLVMNVVNQKINMAQPVCEEYETYTNDDGLEVFVCYMVLEIDKEAALRPVFNGINGNNSGLIQNDYEKFKDEFDQRVAEEAAKDAAEE